LPFFISPDGVRLHYEVEGAGPPLLLHLGSGCDSELWRAAGYVEPLSSSYSCILFDHRGHGASDHPSDAAANHIDRYAADVVALLDHLGHDKIAFFGWSTGVTVGLKAAHQHPGRFRALVLFGAFARPATQAQIEASTADRLAGMREKGWTFILDDMVVAEKHPVPQWFLDRVMATDSAPWFAYTEARPQWNWSVWDALPQVRIPTLLLAGELEDPDDVAGEASALMAQATRVRVPEREHINAFLYSEFVVPVVLEFLDATV
jgi:pimeloyl-ACP methyl ester carboxylesterase